MIKVSIIGPQSSGKAWFVDSLNQKSKKRSNSNSAISFFQTNALQYGKTYNIQYWSISGKKSCLNLAKTYIKSADCILVFLSWKSLNSRSLIQWTQCLENQKEKTILLLDNSLSSPKLSQLQSEIVKRGWRTQRVKFGLEKQYEKIQKMIIEQNQRKQNSIPNCQEMKHEQILSKQKLLRWSVVGVGLLLSAGFLKKFS